VKSIICPRIDPAQYQPCVPLRGCSGCREDPGPVNGGHYTKEESTLNNPEDVAQSTEMPRTEHGMRKQSM
jgi:hypothetical protein